MRISLCLIVKDEQELLPGCLDSVQGVVDEIILVDTGSTDQTVAIAEQHGARVFPLPWSGDFSAARNHGLEQAVGDWILVLDADERLLPATAARLRQAVDGCAAEAMRLHVRDLVQADGQTECLLNLSTRLFRNRSEYRYQRRVHEQIDGAILAARLGPPPVNSNLIIEHLGYLPQVVERKQKRQRNLQLLESEACTLGDGFAFYNLGAEYLRQGRHREALAKLNQAVERLDPRLLVAAEALHRQAICLLELGDYAEAREVLERGAHRYPDFTDLIYHLGEALLHLGQHQAAIAAWQQCREMGDPQGGYYSLEGIGGYRSAYAIGLAYQAQRNYRQATSWYRLALQENPRHLPALQRIAEVLKASLPAAAVAPRLAEYFNFQQTEARLVYLQVLFSVGCYPAVLSLVEELLPAQADSQRLLSMGAVSAFHCGRLEQCIRWSEQLAAQSNSMLEPLLWLLVAHWVRGELALAQRVVSRLSGRGEEMLHAVCQQLQWYAEGKGIFSLSIDFSNPEQRSAFHAAALQVLHLIVITGQRDLLAKALPILNPLESLDAWLELGLDYAKYGLDDLAWAELRDCEQRGRTSPATLLALGRLAVRKRAFGAAVDYLSRALQASPDNLEARELLASSCRQLAEQILLEGIERFPDAPGLVAELAKLRQKGVGQEC